MTKFRIIGAAALSIVLAGPAIAYDGYAAQGTYTQAFRGYHLGIEATRTCADMMRDSISRLHE
jgi:hypothetical protein